MNDEDMTARLAEALARHYRDELQRGLVTCICGWRNESIAYIETMVRLHRQHVAAALLPVVREIADQRAAEELEHAGNAVIAATQVEGLPGVVVQTLTTAATGLYARAAALRGEAGRG